jgi:hypothetical protein
MKDKKLIIKYSDGETGYIDNMAEVIDFIIVNRKRN